MRTPEGTRLVTPSTTIPRTVQVRPSRSSRFVSATSVSSMTTSPEVRVSVDPSRVASTPVVKRSASHASWSASSGSQPTSDEAGSPDQASVPSVTSYAPNMVLHPADTDIVSPSKLTRTGSPGTSSWPSTLVDSYVVPSRSATAATGVLDGVGLVVGVVVSAPSSPSSEEPQPASRPTRRSAAAAPSRAGAHQKSTASRMIGQVMQCPPPRPRPSSAPTIVMTSTPALRSRVLVRVFRS